MNRERPVMTVKELAEYLGLHTSSIYRMVKHNEGPPHFRMGSKLRWNFEDVEVWAAGASWRIFLASKTATPLKAVK